MIHPAILAPAEAVVDALVPLVDGTAAGHVAKLRLLHLRAALDADDEAAVVRHCLCALDERRAWWPDLAPVLDSCALDVLEAYAAGLDEEREAVRSAPVVSLDAFRAARSGDDAPPTLPSPGVA